MLNAAMDYYEDAAALLVSAADLAGIKRSAAEAGLEPLEKPPTVSTRKPSAKVFPCQIAGCGRAFTREQHLASHMRTHTGEKPFVCLVENCGRSFAREDNLAEHTRTHTKEKPFPCPAEGCGKSFSHHRSLTDHVRTHTGDRPFACPHDGCGKAFTQQGHLRIHRRTHTGERPFSCPVAGCIKTFSSSTSRARHTKTHQKQLIAAGVGVIGAPVNPSDLATTAGALSAAEQFHAVAAAAAAAYVAAPANSMTAHQSAASFVAAMDGFSAAHAAALGGAFGSADEHDHHRGAGHTFVLSHFGAGGAAGGAEGVCEEGDIAEPDEGLGEEGGMPEHGGDGVVEADV